jgi:GNAT superfamily N-acetyltransferase
VKVRPVRADEGARLREIRLRSLASDPHAFGATWERDAALAPEVWEQRAAGTTQRTFVVVDEADTWLGLAVVRPDDESTAVVNAMWVAPEARRQGASRALLDACAAWARSHGFAAVTLNVGVANSVARAAYAAAGFEFEREDGDEHVLKRALL